MTTLPSTFARDAFLTLKALVAEATEGSGETSGATLAKAGRLVKVYEDAAARQRLVLDTIEPEQMAALRRLAGSGGFIRITGGGAVARECRELVKLGLLNFEMTGPTRWEITLTEKGAAVLT